MENIRSLRKWFQEGFVCMGLDLKDAFFHVHTRPLVNKFLQFHWRGKLYKWKVSPFGLKFSPRIFTFMVKPILCFCCSKGISLTAFMDNFTIQGRCYPNGILKNHMIALALTYLFDISELVGFQWFEGQQNQAVDTTQNNNHLVRCLYCGWQC